MYRIYNENNIFQRIKFGRLRWAGHVAGIREDDSARKVFLARHLARTWRRGRPRLRWSDCAHEETEKLRTTYRRMEAFQRNGWFMLLEEAKTGCIAAMKSMQSIFKIF